MQQRVAIARAVAFRPEILLLDEPFASVDALTRADLEDLTLALRDEFGITMLLVTHDIDEAVYLSDRVFVLARRRRPCSKRSRSRSRSRAIKSARARKPASSNCATTSTA